MQLDNAIAHRCSIREFSKKSVEWSKILEAIDSASKAPFAGNINNLIFVIVENQNLKNAITSCCQQDWIAEAPFIVVICSNESPLVRMYDERGRIYSRQQAGAAIQNFLLKLIDLGLSGCWVGAYSDSTLRQNLKIPKEINIEALIPVGYMAKTCRTKQAKKNSLDNLIRWNNWNTKKKPETLGEPRE